MNTNRSRILTSATAALLAVPTSVQEPAEPDRPAGLGSLAVSFEQNLGQYPAWASHAARGRSYSLYLTGTGASMALHSARGTDRVRMEVVGRSPSCAVVAEDRLRGHVNHYRGADPAGWHEGVPLFGRVRYCNVLPGIDLLFHGREGELEYDFVVAPGADPSAIRTRFAGANGLGITAAGDLLVAVPGGEITHRRPVAFQNVDGERTQVAAEYRVSGDEVSFDLGRYDPTRTLVIDPVVVWATHLGGSGDDFEARVDADAAGNVYVFASTDSDDFPMVEPRVRGIRSGQEDFVVTKIAPDGRSLRYSTYIGGSLMETVGGADVEESGGIVVAGTTWSSDYPVTGTGFQTVRPSANIAGVVTFLNPADGSLLYSTYLGGSSATSVRGAFVDPFGARIFVTGDTGADDFPVTQNVVQGQRNGGQDAFVTVLDPNRNGRFSLLHSTFFGGSGGERGLDVAFDGNDIGVVGVTGSPDLTAVNAFQGALAGQVDLFFATFNLALTQVGYSTYFGGSLREAGSFRAAIAAGVDGKFVVTSDTTSPDLPTTPGAFRGALGGSNDAFVAKFDHENPIGPRTLTFATYLGGAGIDAGRGVTVDEFLNVYVAGFASSGVGFPLQSPLQGFGGGGSDAFLAVLDPTGSRLRFSTFLGGNGTDVADDVARSAVGGGRVFLAGSTNQNFPVTPGAFQQQPQGRIDLFAARIALPLAQATQYGQGLAGTLGVPVINIRETPVLGGVLDLFITNSAGIQTAGVLVVGTQEVSLPTPIGGTLLVFPLFTVNIVLPAGGLQVPPIPITADNAACGLTVRFQAVEVDAGAPAGFSFTPGAAARLGI